MRYVAWTHESKLFGNDVARSTNGRVCPVGVPSTQHRRSTRCVDPDADPPSAGCRRTSRGAVVNLREVNLTYVAVRRSALYGTELVLEYVSVFARPSVCVSKSCQAVRPSARQSLSGRRCPAGLVARPRCSPWNYRGTLCCARTADRAPRVPTVWERPLTTSQRTRVCLVCAGANSEQGCRVARSHHRRTRSGRTQPPLASALHRESRQARSEQHTSMAPTRERDLRAACPRAERSIPSARLLLGRSLSRSLSLSLSLSAHTPSCGLPVRSVACM
jgi:hypothetical protein